MENIFDELAKKLSEELGFTISYSNDLNINDSERKNTRGVLRLGSTERGLNKDLYSEKISMTVNFIVNLDEYSENEFVAIGRSFMNDMQASSLEFADIIARLLISGLYPVGTEQTISGTPYIQYLMEFECYLSENMIISDNVEIKVNDSVLKGVINYTDSSQFSRDTHIRFGNNVPYGVATTKMRVYSIQFIPLKGNEAAKALFDAHKNLDEDSLKLKVKWPADVADEDALIIHNTNVWITQFDTNLQIGQYGQSKVVLSEYSEVL